MSNRSQKSRRDFLIKSFQAMGLGSLASMNLMGAAVKAASAESCDATEWDMPPAQSIYKFGGRVISDDTLLETVEIGEKTIVRANSSIVTGDGSYIALRIGKDAHFIRKNSIIEFDGSNFRESSMRLVSGAVLSVFAEREKDEELTISTATATVGIRGTGIYMQSEPQQNRSYICTCYGKVDVASSADPNQKQTIETTHHDNPVYVYGNKITRAKNMALVNKYRKKGEQTQAKLFGESSGESTVSDEAYADNLIVSAPFKDHTDAELMLIEGIVCRTTPFGSPKEAYPRRRKSY